MWSIICVAINHLPVSTIRLPVMIIKLSQILTMLCYMGHDCCFGHGYFTSLKHIQLHFPKLCVWKSLGHCPLSLMIALFNIIIICITLFVTGENLSGPVKYSYILWFHGSTDCAEANQDVQYESGFTRTGKVILKPCISWMCKS